MLELMRNCCRESCDDRSSAICCSPPWLQHLEQRYSTLHLNARNRLSKSNHTNRWAPQYKMVRRCKLQFMKRVSRRRDEHRTEMMFIIGITSCANRPNRKHYRREQTPPNCVTLWVTVMQHSFYPERSFFIDLSCANRSIKSVNIITGSGASSDKAGRFWVMTLLLDVVTLCCDDSNVQTCTDE